MFNELVNKIEAILFYKAEPVSRSELKSILKVSEKEIDEAVRELKEKWQGGVNVSDDGDSILFMTSASVAPIIEALKKEELEKELGKASLETLTIILYKGPISRREIDFIRGVQSQYILRSLVSRGLIERLERGAEGYAYKPTHELLGYLGIKSVSELPEFGSLTAELQDRLDNMIEKTETEENSDKNESK